MSALPVWTCEFAPLSGEGATPLNGLTVGSKFALNCRGDIPVEWKESSNIDLLFAKKEDQYSLAVLKVEKLNANEAVLLVTGYKAGKHEPEYIRVVQGELGFETIKPQWQIQSVLKQGEQAQPVPPFGPWNLALPMWIMLALAIFLTAVGILLVRFIRRRIQRNRMLTELERHTTAMQPVNQFYRDARQLRRRLNSAQNPDELKAIATDLNREFRLYILRQFQVPALEWSDRAIVDDLRKRHRKVYDYAGEPLRRTLRELTRISTLNQILLPDVEQLHRMSMNAVERVEEGRAQGKTKGAR